MHAYLPGIGFSNVRDRRAMDLITDDIIKNFDEKSIFHSEDGRLMAEFSRKYTRGGGVCAVGELDQSGEFRMEYAYPYYQGTRITMKEELTIERQTGREAYSVAVDDPRLGITLIVYMRNMGEFLGLMDARALRPGPKPVVVSAIAMDGMVILPVKQTTELENVRRRADIQRRKLINAARDGDEEAIESLTTQDYDTYNRLSRRMMREDILTIVESYIMPCGVECDQYNILGTIRRLEAVQNNVTGEPLYQMLVECNEMPISVCINAADLMGTPQVGRRFKGRVWLMGKVLFSHERK